MKSQPSTDSTGQQSAPTSTVIVPKVTALHPKIANAIHLVVTECKARGMIVGMESGLRDPDKQQALYNLGRTVLNPDGACSDKPMGDTVTNALPWTSWHNLGLAVDITPVNSKGQFFWWPDADHRWIDLANVAKIYGFEWGGAWATFKGDLDHFQMRGSIPNVHEAKRILFEEGLDKLWAMV